MGDKSVGLIGKFIVRRTDGSDTAGGRHEGCDYFVLDLTHDPLAFPALAAYEQYARAAGYVALANDLTRKLAPLRDLFASYRWEGREVFDDMPPVLSIDQKRRIHALVEGTPQHGDEKTS